MEIAEFVTLVDRGGVFVLLAIIVIGGMKGWYVWRREADKAEEALTKRFVDLEAVLNERFQELARDRDWWRDVAVRSLRIGEAAVGQSIERSNRPDRQ